MQATHQLSKVAKALLLTSSLASMIALSACNYNPGQNISPPVTIQKRNIYKKVNGMLLTLTNLIN
ncbi:hypothetical protein IC770_12160 [Acinetobacter seifertii]|nr:hypothetical protein IC770_12160 [Acinetobacter seifertii]